MLRVVEVVIVMSFSGTRIGKDVVGERMFAVSKGLMLVGITRDSILKRRQKNLKMRWMGA